MNNISINQNKFRSILVAELIFGYSDDNFGLNWDQEHALVMVVW